MLPLIQSSSLAFSAEHSDKVPCLESASILVNRSLFFVWSAKEVVLLLSAHCLHDAGCTAPQIEEHLSLQVPFTVIFEYPTIRLLATHVLDLLTNPDSASLREPETGAPPSPVSPACMLCCGQDRVLSY